MNSNLDPRHVARAIALQILFAKLHADQNSPETNELLEELEATSYDASLTNEIVEGVVNLYTEIDKVVQKLAPAWPINQIAPVDLAIIRMGIWEGFIAKKNPIKVVINEVVELGKQFGGETSGSFINGVLGGLAKNEELQTQVSKLHKVESKTHE